MALAALLAVPAAAHAGVGVAPATEKVLPASAADGGKTARLTAARNEFEAFQIVIKADGSAIGGVTASASPLRGPGGATIPASNVWLFREDLVQVTQPSGAIGRAGYWPDALVPAVDEVDGEARNAFPFTVPAGQARAIWVDVLVPPNAEPGAYRGSVEVTGAGVNERINVELEVHDFALSSTPSLASAFLIFTGNMCVAHTGNSECGSQQAAGELAAKYQRLALDHRITLPNIWTIRPKAGDWSQFDEAFAPLLDGAAATRLPGAKMTSAQYAWERTEEGYRAFAKHFRDMGWFERLYVYAADEPPFGSNWSDIPTRAAMVKAADPDLKVLVTTNIDLADKNGVTSNIDLMVPVVNHMESNKDPYVGDQRPKYDGFLSGGKELWTYQSCMSHGCSFGGGELGAAWPSYMIDVPAMRNRVMQWADFKAGVSGELYYETVNTYNADPWGNQFSFSGNGDGTLFYPGTPGRIGGSSQVPVASIRLKMIRDGVEDYEYLNAVAALGDPGFAKQVASEILPSAYQADVATPASLQQAREKLAKRIKELGKGRSGPVAGITFGSLSGGLSGGGGGSAGGCSTGGAGLFGLLPAAMGLAAFARRRRT